MTPEVDSTEATAIAMLLDGRHPIAVSVDTGVGLRTAYRWAKEVRALRVVRVGKHRATFAVRRGGLVPLRVSAWR
jgi:hypothetical protein